MSSTTQWELRGQCLPRRRISSSGWVRGRPKLREIVTSVVTAVIQLLTSLAGMCCGGLWHGVGGMLVEYAKTSNFWSGQQVWLYSFNYKPKVWALDKLNVTSTLIFISLATEPLVSHNSLQWNNWADVTSRSLQVIFHRFPRYPSKGEWTATQTQN